MSIFLVFFPSCRRLHRWCPPSRRLPGPSSRLLLHRFGVAPTGDFPRPVVWEGKTNAVKLAYWRLCKTQRLLVLSHRLAAVSGGRDFALGGCSYRFHVVESIGAAELPDSAKFRSLVCQILGGAASVKALELQALAHFHACMGIVIDTQECFEPLGWPVSFCAVNDSRCMDSHPNFEQSRVCIQFVAGNELHERFCRSQMFHLGTQRHRSVSTLEYVVCNAVWAILGE